MVALSHLSLIGATLTLEYFMQEDLMKVSCILAKQTNEYNDLI